MGEMEYETVIETIGTKYTAEILRATHEPRSANELSDRLDIPIATTYRRLEHLTDTGLVTRIPADETDRDSAVYQRTIDQISLSFATQTAELTKTE